MTETENLLVKNIEAMTKTSLLLLIDTLYESKDLSFWQYDFPMPKYFEKLYNKSKQYTLDLNDILSTDVETKEKILNDIRMYQSQHIFEMFKLTMYRNYVNLLSLKLSNMNTFSVNKNIVLDKETFKTEISNYINNISTTNELSDILTYFPVVNDKNLINNDLRTILTKDFSNLEEIEARLAYINFKNYILPFTFEEFSTDFKEFSKEIKEIDEKLKETVTEDVFNETRKQLGELESKIINVISDLNIVFENFNSLIILITNIENFEYLFENDLVLKDLYHTFVNIITLKETNEAIVEQFEERLSEVVELRIDEVQNLCKKSNELSSFSDREKLMFEGYQILHSLFYADIETSFTTTTYLLNHFDSEYFETHKVNKSNIVDSLLDNLLLEINKADSFFEKALFSQLFRIVNYPLDKDSLIASFINYFNDLDDYKTTQYENLLFFLKNKKQ